MLMNGWYQAGNGIVSPSQIPWNLYDVVYNFAAAPNSDGTINLLWLDPVEISSIVAAGHAVGKKVLVVVKDEGVHQFAAVTTPGTISNFVANLTKFVNSNNFDGLTIDWEQNIVISQYKDLLTRLRGNLGSKTIMCDMGDWGNMQQVAQDRQSIVDGFNIMCYAMSNGDNTETLFDAMTFQGNTGLRAMDSRMKAFSGVTPSKLLVGIPFYCVRWQGASQPFVKGQFPAPVSQNYQDLVKDPLAWQPGNQQYDSANAGQYLSVLITNQFIPYVGPRQINDIVAWAKTQGFGGIAPFVLSYDDAPAFTLSNALNQAIKGNAPVVPQFPCTVTTKIASDGVTATTVVTRP